MRYSPSVIRTVLIIGLVAATGIFATGAAASSFDLQTLLNAAFGTSFSQAADDISTTKGTKGGDTNRTEAQQFSQGFEVDNVWDATAPISNPNRVASGTNGITSKTGGFHAEVTTESTDWGGYNSAFPSLGYVTSVDIYLNVAGAFANDTRFDWDVASNRSNGNHLQDFAFNGGYYNDATGPGAGVPRFVFSASNNTGRANSNPKNPARNPIAITATGWYTFRHHFYNNGSGVLAVDLSIVNSNGVAVGTWTFSDVANLIPSVVGGNRYGWVAANEFAFIALDNAYRANIAAPTQQIITQADLTNTPNITDWFFYQDWNTPPFSEGIDNNLGTMVKGPSTPPSGLGSVQISTSGDSRPNIATYQFSGTVLADINELKFSTYNPSAGNPGAANRSGYLHFNVDFLGNDTWQRRLVYVPSNNGTVIQDTWQEWDAISGGGALWSYSGLNWPVGPGGGGELGTTLKTWNQILNQYPGVKMRTTDSFLGIRVGEPYNDGYTENIDKFVFGTASATYVFDFEPEMVMVDDDGQASTTDCDAPDAAYSTIQSGINAVTSATKVMVCPGTYNESPLIQKSVTIESTDGYAVTTIVTLPGGQNPIRILNNTTPLDVTIDGFTIQGHDGTGSTASLNASQGIRIDTADGHDVKILNNRIQIGTRIGGDADQGIGIINTSNTLRSMDVHVEGNIFEPVTTEGQRAFYINPGVTNFTFKDNQINGRFTSPAFTQAKNGLVEGNTLTGDGTGTSGGFGTWGHPNPVTSGHGKTTFLSNTITGTNVGISVVWTEDVTIIGNTITNNQTGVRVYSTGSPDATGTVVNFNRIANNAVSGILNETSQAINAENNWWGCNYGPGASGLGCPVAANGITGAGAANVDANPWLTLTTSASVSPVVFGGTSNVTSALTINSNAVNTTGAPDGTPASFVGTLGTVAPPTDTTVSGIAETVFTAGNTPGSGGVATTVDGQTVNAPIGVYANVCVSASAPTNLTTLPGQQVVVPINVDEVTGRNIFSFTYVVKYDPDVLQYVGLDHTGTLASGWSLIVNPMGTPDPDTLVIVGFTDSSIPLTGSGPLMKLRFTAVGGIGDTSDIEFTQFDLNESSPCAATSNGLVTLISSTVSGTVTYIHSPAKPVPHTDITVTGSPAVASTSTDLLGNYSLSGFGPGSYTVTPSKNVITNVNGITAQDASTVAQHVALILTLNSNQMLAADVTGNGTVTALDASYIAQWVAFVPNPGNTGSWKFLPVSRSYTNVATPIANENYQGILMGEVTGNWTVPLARSQAKARSVSGQKVITVSAPDVMATRGGDVLVSVSVPDISQRAITAYQFDLEYDPNVLSSGQAVAEVTNSLSRGMAAVTGSSEPGKLRVVVYGVQPIRGAGPLVQLRFRSIGMAGATSPLRISNFILGEGDHEVVTRDGSVTIRSTKER